VRRWGRLSLAHEEGDVAGEKDGGGTPCSDSGGQSIARSSAQAVAMTIIGASCDPAPSPAPQPTNLLGSKKYAESLTPSHSGKLTRGFVETWNALNQSATYAVEIWHADLLGIPTGTHGVLHLRDLQAPPSPLASGPTLVLRSDVLYEATSCSWRSRSLISSLSFAAYSNLSSSAASSISAWRSAMRFWSSSGSRGVSRAAFWRWVL
jgi:hypothetical protein